MGSYWDASGKLVDGRFELANRNVEEVVIFNALAIVNTTVQDSVNISVLKYKTLNFKAYNSLNQPVNLGMSMVSDIGIVKAVSYWDGTAWKVMYPTLAGSISITANDAWNEVTSFWTWIRDFRAKTIRLHAYCSVAPTAGSLTVILEGEII